MANKLTAIESLATGSSVVLSIELKCTPVMKGNSWDDSLIPFNSRVKDEINTFGIKNIIGRKVSYRFYLHENVECIGDNDKHPVLYSLSVGDVDVFNYKRVLLYLF